MNGSGAGRDAVELRSVEFGYSREARIFSGLSLSVPRGKVTALLGPNGSGKSTLMGLILGFLVPDSGSIDLLGKPVTAYGREEMGRVVGYVAQSVSLPYNYSVLDYVLLGRTARLPRLGLPDESDRAAAGEAMGRAGIAHLAARHIQELSAGEQQLVAIARALAQEPMVLLMDEPTSHLDPANAVSVYRLMNRLSEDTLTICFTTHDPMHAGGIADYVLLLKKGAVAYAGDASEGLTPGRLSQLYGIEFREALDGSTAVPYTHIEKFE